MKIRIITFCLILVAIFSCKKDEMLNNGPTVENQYVPKLSKIMVDNISDEEYLYNDSSLLVQQKSKFDFTQNHYNSIAQLISSDFYGNDDILSNDLSIYETAMNQTAWVTPSTGKKGGVIAYEYNAGGQLVKTTTTRPALAVAEYSDFTYDANNRISRQSMFWDNVATGYIDYAYDAKGNLVSEMLYNLPVGGAAELITTTTYTFDNQQNPLKSYSKLPIPGLNTNPNNILKETYTMHTGSAEGSDKVQVTENTYEYNALGYPISKNGNVTYVY
jgi:hypothetical protein